MLLRARLYIGLIFLLITMTIVISAAISLPQTQWQFSISNQQQLLASQHNQAAQVVELFHAGQHDISVNFHLALEEPDNVANYIEFNQLMSDNTLLLENLNRQKLSMRLADGSTHQLNDRQRTLFDLPGMFWLQLTCGFLGFLICLLIRASGHQSPGINHFFLTGLGYLISIYSAAIYSTKNLLIDGNLFHVLSMLNHIGAMLFSASLTVFLWNYPKKIAGNKIGLIIYLIFSINIFVDALQLVEGPPTGHYLWVFSVFMFGILGSGIQWWLARKSPLDRGIVRWLLLSIYAGTIFFTGGMLIPMILGINPLAPQGILFTTFLLMYGGLALGVMRYRLFELERWWFSIWSWFLGGVAILLVDLLLASLLTLSNTSALALATAIIGWVYFPLRQWCWQKISYRRGLDIEIWLPKAVANLITVKTQLELELAWEQSLNDLYQPLALHHSDGVINQTSILDNGMQLAVPRIDQQSSLIMHNASQGQRLFTRNDTKNCEILLTIFQLMKNNLMAKTEGANNERNRIRQDIHDDLGAKLLSILHSSKEERPVQLAKEALSDLKNLLQNIEIEPIDINFALSLWRQEAEERITNDIRLSWRQAEANYLQELPPKYFSHLTRAIRECITNALRHAQATEVIIDISVDDNINIGISNNGVNKQAEKNGGRGSDILQQRCQSLGGSFKSQQDDNHWRVDICIPIPTAQ